MGLPERDLKIVQQVFGEFPEIKTATLFGSRAMGNAKKGSDVDIALKGDLNPSVINRIKDRLEEETDLPYFFDIVDHNAIQSEDLLEHIKEHGQAIE